MSTEPGDYQTALQLIRNRSDYDRGYISNPRSGPSDLARGLERVRALLELLGQPDRAYPIVHVAGSKGKGSTSAFIAAIGRAAGYRCGLFTSPHLHSFRERIAIDSSPIDESTFAALVFATEEAIQTLEINRPDVGSVTAFEFLTVMALVAFANAHCDLAVIEVGLGGTHDATNVVRPAVSVITQLDYEHTQILGSTLAEIAENKAGIIKAGIPVITVEQDPEAQAVIAGTADRLGAPLFVASRDFDAAGAWRDFSWRSPDRTIEQLRTGMAGAHQRDNASLAVAVWGELAGAGFEAPDSAIRAGIRAASLPGRFERVEARERQWILDGAHTPIAAAALAAALLDEFGGPVLAIAGFLNDKRPEPFLAELAPALAELILTEPANPRALPASELAPIVHSAIPQVTIRPTLDTALQEAHARTDLDTPIVITGSLTLVAQARELLGLASPDPTGSRT